MKVTEKQELKKKLKRLGLFLLIVFLPALVVASLIIISGAPQWLNIMIMVIVLFVMYALFLLVCSKLDKKKQKRLEKKKDPFSD